MTASLTVVFVGQAHEVAADQHEGLTFGRGAALDLDSNPFMNRRVGRFLANDGRWWLENLSGSTSLRVDAGGVSTILPPEELTSLDHPVSVVTFDAGACRYELQAVLPELALRPAAPAPPLDDLAATLRPVAVQLSQEQRLLVVALAEHRLREPGHKYRLPTNRSVARRLGWTDAKFNRKLDYLCARLARDGVPGMRIQGRRATDRRLHLVDHMLSSGQVTAQDLHLLTVHSAASEGQDR